MFITYLTIYSGELLPPYYIGSTSKEKYDKGYCGTVQSKAYKEIWLSELKNNRELFDVIILSVHNTRKEAMEEELRLQKKLNVVKSSSFINLALAQPNGFFGKTKGHPSTRKGKKLSDETREKMKLSHIGVTHTEEAKLKIGLSLKGKKRPSRTYYTRGMTGKIHSDETKSKMSANNKRVMTGVAPPNKGKKIFHDPITRKQIYAHPGQEPDGFIKGYLPKLQPIRGTHE